MDGSGGMSLPPPVLRPPCGPVGRWGAAIGNNTVKTRLPSGVRFCGGKRLPLFLPRTRLLFLVAMVPSWKPFPPVFMAMPALRKHSNCGPPPFYARFFACGFAGGSLALPCFVQRCGALITRYKLGGNISTCACPALRCGECAVFPYLSRDYP